MMRNPTGLFSPHWSPTYLGTRLLVVLFWFIVSLALTSVMPGTISRGVARLQLTSLRVAVIRFIGVVVLFASVPLSLWIMPEPIRVMIGLMALLLLLVASVFGRVILYAATGRWLQRKYVHVGRSYSGGPLARDHLLGVVDVAALRLAFHGGVHIDHQFPDWPSRRGIGLAGNPCNLFSKKISINSYAVVFTRQKGQVMRALAFTVISLITSPFQVQ